MKRLLVVSIFQLTARLLVAQDVIYVDVGASGLNDGSSWTDAFTSLQDAINSASAGDDLWVSGGVYLPDRGAGIRPGDTTASFSITKALSVFGGFSGTETHPGERDSLNLATVLSGDLLQNDSQAVEFDSTRADNSLWVVRVEGVSGASFDRLTVESSAARDRLSQGACMKVNQSVVAITDMTIRRCIGYVGGGIRADRSDFRISQARFVNNYADAGGGMASFRGSLRANDLELSQNVARNDGAGLYLDRGVDTLSNIEFIHNQSGAGALYNHKGNIYVANAVFRGNSARFFGAAYCSGQGNTVFVNSEFVDNSAPQRGSTVHQFDSTIVLTNSTIVRNSGPYILSLSGTHLSPRHVVNNSIIWENDGSLFDNPESAEVTVANSILQEELPEGLIDGGGNHYVDPLFVSDDDFALTHGSPGIDTGKNDWLGPDVADLDMDGDHDEFVPIDLVGSARIFSSSSKQDIVDLGAYEFGPTPPTGVEHAAMPHGIYTLTLYPNPSKNWLNVKIEPATRETVTFMIYDVHGRRVQTSLFPPLRIGSFEIDVSGLSPGVYVLTSSINRGRGQKLFTTF